MPRKRREAPTVIVQPEAPRTGAALPPMPQPPSPEPPEPPEITYTPYIADDLTSASLTVDFGNGASTVIDLATWQSPKAKLSAALYGIERRIRATRDKVEITQRLMTGDWPEPGERGSGHIPLIVEASARLAGIPPQTAYARWKELDEEMKKAVRADQRVKSVMAQIKSEREAPSADVTTIFGSTA